MLKKRNIFRIANLLLGITSKGLEIVDCRFFAKTAASSAAAVSWGRCGAGLGLLLACDDRDARVLFGSRVTTTTTKKKNAGPIPETRSSALPIDIGSLSAKEIELSEDYTCVISHGPNPKTVHIFGDRVLESLPGSHCFSMVNNKILFDEQMEKEPTADGKMFVSD